MAVRSRASGRSFIFMGPYVATERYIVRWNYLQIVDSGSLLFGFTVACVRAFERGGCGEISGGLFLELGEKIF
jgi:hypothetical protein